MYRKNVYSDSSESDKSNCGSRWLASSTCYDAPAGAKARIMKRALRQMRNATGAIRFNINQCNGNEGTSMNIDGIIFKQVGSVRCVDTICN